MRSLWPRERTLPQAALFQDDSHPMAAQPKKNPAWSRPRLAAADIDADLSSPRHAELALQAEQAYDFDLARQHWLCAAHAATAAEAATAVTRYAEFLVERYGQFAEVAQWLDDPRFGLSAESRGPAANLPRLLARAAAEAGHPRSEELDLQAAGLGDADAAVRASRRCLGRGDTGQAAAILDAGEAQWPAGSAARQLMLDLRQQAAQRAAEAFAPLHQAIAAGDLTQAKQIIEGLQGQWGSSPHLAAARTKLQQALAHAHAAELRQGAQQSMHEGDWRAAVAQVKALTALPVATEADRAWRRFVEDAAQGAAAQALVEQAELQPLEQAWQTMAQIVALYGARGELTAARPDHALHTAWAVLGEAQALAKGTPLTARLPALPALASLAQQPDADPDDLRQWIARLPAEWLGVAAVQAAKRRVDDHDAALQATEESAFAEAVQTMLDHDELDDATAALAEWSRRAGTATAVLQQLRRDLLLAKQLHAQRHKTTSEFQASLNRGAWFHARSLLADLSHLLPMEQVEALREELQSVSGPALRGAPMPPGLQKLSHGPLAAGVVGDRLLVVQDGLWLAVVLPSLGLQPFALPQGWAIRAEATVRLAQVAGRVRLVGLCADRLVVVEQQAGEPPVIEGAIELRQALRGDDLLLGASLDPTAPSFCLLSRHSQRGTATTWTRLDSHTLEVLSHKRFVPALAGAQQIAHWPGRHLVVAHSRERQGGQGWALAIIDDDGEVQSRWRDADLGEWIAGLRQVVAWPEADRVFASFTYHDPFDPKVIRDEPSLLVLRGDKVVFSSTDLRRRFFPTQPLQIDHAWTLDPVAGRLWFAALTTEGQGPRDALLLGVDARSLRADQPAVLPGVARVLALMAVADGVVALCLTHAKTYTLVRGVLQGGVVELTSHKLPL